MYFLEKYEEDTKKMGQEVGVRERRLGRIPDRR